MVFPVRQCSGSTSVSSPKIHTVFEQPGVETKQIGSDGLSLGGAPFPISVYFLFPFISSFCRYRYPSSKKSVANEKK